MLSLYEEPYFSSFNGKGFSLEKILSVKTLTEWHNCWTMVKSCTSTEEWIDSLIENIPPWCTCNGIEGIGGGGQDVQFYILEKPFKLAIMGNVVERTQCPSFGICWFIPPHNADIINCWGGYCDDYCIRSYLHIPTLTVPCNSYIHNTIHHSSTTTFTNTWEWKTTCWLRTSILGDSVRWV